MSEAIRNFVKTSKIELFMKMVNGFQMLQK